MDNDDLGLIPESAKLTTNEFQSKETQEIDPDTIPMESFLSIMDDAEVITPETVTDVASDSFDPNVDDSEYSGIDITDLVPEFEEELENTDTEDASELDTEDVSKDLGDTLYVYYKAQNDEQRKLKAWARSKVPITKLTVNSKRGVVSQVIPHIYYSCVEPIIRKMPELDPADRRTTEMNIFMHLLSTHQKSIAENIHLSDTDYMGKWAKYIVNTSDEVVYQSGIIYISLLDNVDVSQCIACFKEQSAIAEEMRETRASLPTDLIDNLSFASQYIRKSATASNMRLNFGELLKVSPQESYVLDKDFDFSTKFALGQDLFSDSKNQIYTHCTCDTPVKIRDSIALVMQDSSRKNKPKLYIRLRYAICPNCGRRVVLDYRLIGELIRILYTELSSNDSFNNCNSLESKIGYSTLHLLHDNSVISNIDQIVDLNVASDEIVEIPKWEYKNDYKEFLQSITRVNRSRMVYKKEVTALILGYNDVDCNLQPMIAYIYNKCSSTTKQLIHEEELILASYFQTLANSKLKDTLSDLAERTPEYAYFAKTKSIVDLDKIETIAETPIFMSESLNTVLDIDLANILGKEINLQDYRNNCVLSPMEESTLKISLIGKYIQDFLLAEDAVNLETMITHLFNAFITSKVYEKSAVINMPDKFKFTVKIKKQIMQFKKITHSISIETFLNCLGYDINVFKSLALEIFMNNFKSVYEIPSEMYFATLNGEMADSLEFFFQCKQLPEIIKEYLEVDNEVLLDDSSTSETGEQFNINVRVMILIMLLETFPESKWKHGDWYRFLANYINTQLKN